MESVVDLVLTPDKNVLVTAANDGQRRTGVTILGRQIDLGTTKNLGQLKIWDIRGRNLAKLEPVRTIVAHDSAILALAMSPDGKRVATISTDHSAKLWDLASGNLLRSWSFPVPGTFRKAFLRNITFTPDGKHLVTANYSATLYMLECP
jgi:WD40 repeat protein